MYGYTKPLAAYSECYRRTWDFLAIGHANMLSVVKAGYRFSGAAAPCSGVQGMYKLPAAAFAQCILLPTLQNVGVKLLATF